VAVPVDLGVASLAAIQLDGLAKLVGGIKDEGERSFEPVVDLDRIGFDRQVGRDDPDDGGNAVVGDRAVRIAKAAEGDLRRINREFFPCFAKSGVGGIAVVGVNLTGATMMVREVVAQMAASGARPGVIVNMSSVARHGNRGQSNYTAAKSALAANTVTWAREFASYGVRVGAVAPGMVETPMTQGMNPKARDALVAAIPVGRIGLPEDLWVAVKFVLECDYFNGRTIDVDGGLAM